MDTLDILIAARKLIEQPENWTQGQYARRGPDDHSVEPTSPQAKCFCMVGALANASGLSTHAVERPSPEWKALRKGMDGMSPTRFNDTHTHDEVLAAFDRAIEAARTASAHRDAVQQAERS